MRGAVFASMAASMVGQPGEETEGGPEGAGREVEGAGREVEVNADSLCERRAGDLRNLAAETGTLFFTFFDFPQVLPFFLLAGGMSR